MSKIVDLCDSDADDDCIVVVSPPDCIAVVSPPDAPVAPQDCREPRVVGGVMTCASTPDLSADPPGVMRNQWEQCIYVECLGEKFPPPLDAMRRLLRDAEKMLPGAALDYVIEAHKRDVIRLIPGEVIPSPSLLTYTVRARRRAGQDPRSAHPLEVLRAPQRFRFLGREVSASMQGMIESTLRLGQPPLVAWFLSTDVLQKFLDYVPSDDDEEFKPTPRKRSKK